MNENKIIKKVIPTWAWIVMIILCILVIRLYQVNQEWKQASADLTEAALYLVETCDNLVEKTLDLKDDYLYLLNRFKMIEGLKISVDSVGKLSGVEFPDGAIFANLDPNNVRNIIDKKIPESLFEIREER